MKKSPTVWSGVRGVAIGAAMVISAFASAQPAGPSVARQWNEELLEAIRNDFARPTVHARNLFHTSVAMWDAWAAFDEHARLGAYAGAIADQRDRRRMAMLTQGGLALQAVALAVFDLTGTINLGIIYVLTFLLGIVSAFDNPARRGFVTELVPEEDIANAIEQIALAAGRLGDAYELLPSSAADRLETELFRPTQKALGRSKRAHAHFAEQSGIAPRSFDPPAAGARSPSRATSGSRPRTRSSACPRSASASSRGPGGPSACLG